MAKTHFGDRYLASGASIRPWQVTSSRGRRFVYRSALTLNPSPKKGEGLQSGTPLLPKREKELGDEGESEWYIDLRLAVLVELGGSPHTI